MELTTVHVMRHGEVHNPQGVLYGRMPGFHLSTRGQEMAQIAANWLVEEGEDIRAVIASPIERAQESALPTAKIYDLDIITDDNIIETANYFEGQPVNLDRSLFLRPENLRYYLNPFKPSWGEPYVEVADRMVKAVQQALNLARGGSALVVSHQLPIWVIRRFIEERPLWHDPRKRQCSLASITSLTFRDNTLVGLEYYEPAALLLEDATDMTPGTSVAKVHIGENGVK